MSMEPMNVPVSLAIRQYCHQTVNKPVKVGNNLYMLPAAKALHLIKTYVLCI